MRIDLYRRSDDWMATIENDRKRWECGTTPEEAVKKLHISHPETAGTEIVYRGKDLDANVRAMILEVLL
jgi:hypothetical protein